MAYHTIVCGTDGSVTARLATSRAARIAKRCRAELVLVCAYQPPRQTRVSGQSVLEHAEREIARDRVKVRTVLADGDPTEAILGTAEREQADLVVVGNKGIGAARRIRLGGVPDRIAHMASSDVLIVDTRAATEPAAEADGRRVYARLIVGTDGSPTANEAARKGMEFAMMLGAEVTLVYVGDPIVGAIKLEETANGRPQGVEVSPRVLQGEPAKAICEVAGEVPGTLTVVGNKGMAGARRYLLASVPNEVAHNAPGDVLIAKTVDRSLAEIAPGHGAVIQVKGKTVAVYRDDDGAVSAVSPRCTHMGCTVDWNDAERTWDCPCHGSRYDRTGEVIRGPAARGLAPEEISEK